jgi:ferredoxin
MTAGLEVSSPARAGPSAEVPVGPESFALESRGWSSPGEACGPKVHALASLVNLAAADPVPSVSYQSRGNLLVIAAEDVERARRCAAALAKAMPVTLFSAEPVEAEGFAAWSGRLDSIEGYLGEFAVVLEGLRVGAGAPARAAAPAKFDLVLDFSRAPVFAARQPPQGYFRAPRDEAELEAMLAEVRDSVGEFEKPRYFSYRENICAHSRSQVEGCRACIDICSTEAISSDGDHVKVDPHLCMGCGACATVCPSGAMGYAYPRIADRGAQMKQLLSAYRFADGADACIVFHDGGPGRRALAEAAAAGRGLPARALPLEAWHVAAIGLDLMLPAIAFGASQVVVVASAREDREYLEALRGQMALAEAIVQALGYEGTHFALVEAGEGTDFGAAFAALSTGAAVSEPATFLLGNDKRTAIEFALEHLLRHATVKPEEIALPAGAPYGEVRVDREKCTLCLACVGACPESALMDGVDQPLLKFLERNCVQCGLCEATCPEDAIALSPRLLLTPAVKEARVLNETQPFQCVRCAKPFGTRLMVDAMMGRLAGHSMFSGGDALRRLQMCADCRVVDMMQSKNEVSVLDLRSP